MHQAALSAAAAAQGQGSCAVLMPPLMVPQWKTPAKSSAALLGTLLDVRGSTGGVSSRVQTPCDCGCERLKRCSSLCFTGRPV